MTELIELLQSFWINIRLKINPERKSCQDCAISCGGFSGDNFHEPMVYEWDCPLQENELISLTRSYENAIGEVDWNYATICPMYRELTHDERLAKSLVGLDITWDN